MERDDILERLRGLTRERSQKKARVGEIAALLRARDFSNQDDRKRLVLENGELVARLSVLGGCIRETERELGDVERARALEQMGTDGTATAVLRALLVRVGRMERAFLAACRYVDEPDEHNLGRLKAAIDKSRTP